MSARAYMTAERLGQLSAQLSVRERRLLAETARLGVVTGEQLRRLFYGDSAGQRRLARLDLARLTDQRLLGRLTRQIGGRRAGSEAFAYGLGPAGQRLVYPGRRRYRPPWTPQPTHLAHALAVSELYVRLREAERTNEPVLIDFAAEPACWREFVGPGGGPLVLKPDAYAVVRNNEYEDSYFIEVDRSTESLPRLIAKVRLYGRYFDSGREQARHGVFPLIVWVALDARRMGQIEAAIRRMDAEHRRLFDVTTTEQAARRLLAGINNEEVNP